MVPISVICIEKLVLDFFTYGIKKSLKGLQFVGS